MRAIAHANFEKIADQESYVERAGRTILFVMIFALFWITLTPFKDLRDPAVLLAQEQGSLWQQLISMGLFAISLGFLLLNLPIAQKMLSPLFLLVLLWQLLSVITAVQPDVALRRYIFSITVIVTTMAWVLLPVNLQHFQKTIKYLSLLILMIAFFGVIFMPGVSIHNISEVTELVNAGSWRGHFVHKNVAGPAMIILIMYNLYLIRNSGNLIPVLNIILASIFLYFSNNKTSIGLIFITLILAELIRVSRPFWLKLLILLIPLSLMAALTLGSVMNQTLGDFTASILSDPTFTNRTEIWQFALEQARLHPWLGYGFDSFWNTSALVNGGYETWAASAGHAHNGYLNLVLTTGLIGAALFAIWIIFCPLYDYHKSQKGSNDPQLAQMYLRIWIFMLLYANLEVPFFASRGQVWFSLLAVVFGLRLHARLQQSATSA